MADEIVSLDICDGIGILTWDDGHLNVLGLEAIQAFSQQLTEAQEHSKAVVLAGNPRAFCAGLDLKILNTSAMAARSLITAAIQLLLRIYEHPQPVIIACTGHALAAGAAMLLTGDGRVGSDTRAKIGFNQVQVGFVVSKFTQRLVRERLARKNVTEAVLCGRMYTPHEAAAVGFLDRVVPEEEVVRVAMSEAGRLIARSPGVFAETKLSLREALTAEVRATLDDDMERVMDNSFS